MRFQHFLASCLSPLVLATSLFTGLSVGRNHSQPYFSEAQSLQPPFPLRISLSTAFQQPRSDETPPHQDKQAATPQREPHRCGNQQEGNGRLGFFARLPVPGI